LSKKTVLLQPPFCNEVPRHRRETKNNSDKKIETNDVGVPATIEVYSGFYVNEADVIPKTDYYDVSKERVRNIFMFMRILYLEIILLYLFYYMHFCYTHNILYHNLIYRLEIFNTFFIICYYLTNT
jgi:hypothetical protein